MAEEQKQASTEPAVGGEEESDEQIVTPWTAHAAKGETTIDYEKLISKLSTVAQVVAIICMCVHTPRFRSSTQIKGGPWDPQKILILRCCMA